MHEPRHRRHAAVVAALAAGLTFGLAGCGGDGDGAGTTTTVSSGTTTVVGDVDAGREVFLSNGCGDCHTLQAAGTSGMTGPNLDNDLRTAAEVNGAQLADYVRTSIVSPGAFVMPQWSDGVMPSDYESRVSESELDDLVAFIVASVPEPETQGG